MVVVVVEVVTVDDKVVVSVLVVEVTVVRVAVVEVAVMEVVVKLLVVSVVVSVRVVEVLVIVVAVVVVVLSLQSAAREVERRPVDKPTDAPRKFTEAEGKEALRVRMVLMGTPATNRTRTSIFPLSARSGRSSMDAMELSSSWPSDCRRIADRSSVEMRSAVNCEAETAHAPHWDGHRSLTRPPNTSVPHAFVGGPSDVH